MSKKLSNDYFINQCNIIHNNKYDYSETKYITAKIKIKIICPVHGIFEQEPFSHKSGNGCPKCSNNKKITTDEFIKISNEIHNNKYDYSLVDYKNNYTNVSIKCKKHGIFEQNPSHHKNGGGCKKCYVINIYEFIKKSNEIHNNKYDYSLVDNLNKRKIKIICPDHGIFLQNFYNHMKGHECSKCKKLYHYNTIDFIKISNEIHNNKYDYSLVDYKNIQTKIKIICLKHGIFEQTPNNHLMNNGCPNCSNNKKITTDEFIKMSNEIHNNKYDYSLVNYKNNHTNVSIKCKKHGIFEQNPSHHKNGGGCPICLESKGEKKISKILEKYKINFIKQKTFDNCKNIRKLHFDFYLQDYNLCIEFDGRQHYESVIKFGGHSELIKIKKRDEIKNKFCENNKINLLRIKFNENIINILIDKLNLKNNNKK